MRIEQMGLTHSEFECLKLMAEGYSDKEIASARNISLHTARVHVRMVSYKLGCDNRSRAVAMYYKEQIAGLRAQIRGQKAQTGG